MSAYGPDDGDVADFRRISTVWDELWSFQYLSPAESGGQMVFRQNAKGHGFPACKTGEAVATGNCIGWG